MEETPAPPPPASRDPERLRTLIDEWYERVQTPETPDDDWEDPPDDHQPSYPWDEPLT